MKKIIALIALGLIAVPTLAHAGNYYASIAGGLTHLHDMEVGSVDDSIEFDAGWTGIVAGGYRFNNNMRAELELGYRNNDLDTIHFPAGTTTSMDGEVEAWTALVNAIYEHTNATAFSPYFGIGAGVAHLEFGDTNNLSITTNPESGNDTAFAMQGIAGVNYQINTNLSTFADYRYLTTFDAGIEFNSNSTIEVDYDNSTVLVGLRYNYGSL